jgi:Integrase core domain
MDRPDLDLPELAKTLGYPGVEKLWRAAERRNLPVTRHEVAAFVRAQGQRQVFAKRAKYEGKIVATQIDDRWAADLIDYTSRPDGEFQYILIVQDVFSRLIRAEPLQKKDGKTVLAAFERLLGDEHPRQLDTDHGPEFTKAFDVFLAEHEIVHDVADLRNKNARGTLDSAIKSFRQQLARIQTAENRRDWAALVPRAVEAYNSSVHSSLVGRAPEDVKDDEDLQFILTKKAADNIQTNQALLQGRAARLERLGAFRDELPHKGFERSFQPRYGDEVHAVDLVKGGTVYSDGKAYPTRHVLAVPAHSNVTSAASMQGGSHQTDRFRLRQLEPFANELDLFLQNGRWLHEAAEHMKKLGVPSGRGLTYKKALQLLGYDVAPNGWVTRAPPR